MLLAFLSLARLATAQTQTAVDSAQSIKSLADTVPCPLSECTQTSQLAQQIVDNLCGIPTFTPTPAFSSPNVMFVGYGESNFKVSVGTTFTCALKPTITVPWVTVFSQGSTFVRYEVATNPSSAQRSTVVTMAGKTFTITQEGAPDGPPPPPPPPTTVPAGGDVQAALDAAPAGGTVYLTAGATYTQNIVFRNRSGSVTLTTANFAVPSGTRVAPSDAPTMAKIVCSDCLLPTIGFEFGAHDVSVIGVEVIGNPSHTDRATINVGNDPTTWTATTSVADQPSNITFDRIYEHADATGGRQGILTDGVNINVVNSYISGFWLVGADSQAIGMIQGAGPVLVQNNYLEGSGENMMVGGSDPTINGLIPADITVKDNYFFKPLSWKTDHPGSVKNLFELKNAQRVTVDHNVFENVWVDAQPGSAILFTVRDQGANCPWCVVKDVTFTNNVIKNVANFAFNILGFDDTNPSGTASNLVISNNLILNAINGALLQSPANTIEFSHNTFRAITGKFLALGRVTSGSVVNGFVFRDNAVEAGSFGITGDGTVALGTASLESMVAAGYVFSKNLIAQSSERTIAFPTGNYVVAASAYAGKFDAQNAVVDTTLVATEGGTQLVGANVTKLPQ